VNVKKMGQTFLTKAAKVQAYVVAVSVCTLLRNTLPVHQNEGEKAKKCKTIYQQVK